MYEPNMEFKTENISSDDSCNEYDNDMELKTENFSIDASDDPLSDVKVKRRRISEISSSEDFSPDISSECASPHSPTHCNDIWSDPIGNQPQLTPFIGTPGFTLLSGHYEKIEDIYLLLVDDEIFQVIVEETNRNAVQILSNKSSSRLDDWIATNIYEIKRLFGLIMWMGIVKLPEISLYWSKDPAYSQIVPPSVMSRNRFELLLRMLHFSNNDENVDDEVHKIRVISDMLNENFAKLYEPGEVVYVNESHIHGIQMFKLCTAPGYTTNFQIYFGKKMDSNKTMHTNAVMSLCRNIFSKGHTVCTNNWCTSIDLANKLIAENTHLIGTMQLNSREIPNDLITKQLKRNEYFAKENQDGITLLKWKDRHDVLLLSTKHSDETVVVRKKGNNCVKPKIVANYNIGKSFVEVSDQMSPYRSSLRKTVEWFKKVVFEICLNTAVVNARIIYNTITHTKITCLECRKRVAMYLIACNTDRISDFVPVVPKRARHEIKKKEGKAGSVRKRCRTCYQNNVKKFGTQLARNSTIKVLTFCDGCPDKPHYCLPCFNQVHRNMPL